MESGLGSLLKIILTNLDVLAWPFISLLYPIYASVKAIEHPSPVSAGRWLSYWVIYSIITLVELTFADIIKWIPLWLYAKLGFVCWLMYFNGAAYVYRVYLRPFYMNPQHTINSLLAPMKKTLEQNGGSFKDLIQKVDKSMPRGFMHNQDDGHKSH